MKIEFNVDEKDKIDVLTIENDRLIEENATVRRRLDDLWEEHCIRIEDAQLRSANDGLKLLWDQYQIMLGMLRQ